MLRVYCWCNLPGGRGSDLSIRVGSRTHAGGEAAENGVPGSDGQSVATVALLEKHAKTRLAVAADHFNRDYKKGFQFLQVWHRCCSFFSQSCTVCLKGQATPGERAC